MATPSTPGCLAVGRKAAAAGNFDAAVLALLRAANEFRAGHQPTFEVFALVELAAIYHRSNRLDRLPELARRVRGVMKRPSLTPSQVAIVQLAVELIESGPEDPAGLDIFADCWARNEPQETEATGGGPPVAVHPREGANVR